jgi:uncharacterized protein YqcC (DUF446 family)
VSTTSIYVKVNEIIEELKKNGLWKKSPPSWVNDFDKISIATEQDFADWLQFVYLPNIRLGKGVRQTEISHIVPQAVHYFGDEITKGKLVELLIELDALTGIN